MINVSNNYVSSLAARTLLLSLLWWLLNTNDIASWIIGVPCVLVAVFVSLKLAPPRPLRWRLLRVARFIPVFLWESVKGGIDVSRRVLRWNMPLQPVVIHYAVKLPAGLPRLLFLNVISLLPGTLAADLNKDKLILHVLDSNTPVESELQRIERYIDAMFSFDTKADH